MEEQQTESGQRAAGSGQDELAEAKAQAQEYLDGWKRAMADYANLKRDVERQRDELSKYALVGFVEKLLPTVDSFGKAVAQQPKLKEGEPVDLKQMEKWIEGVGFIRTQIEMALSAVGITSIKDTEVPFDPSLHEAMMSEKREGAPPGSVVKVLEPGYRLHDRVVRPAKVIVAE